MAKTRRRRARSKEEAGDVETKSTSSKSNKTSNKEKISSKGNKTSNKDKISSKSNSRKSATSGKLEKRPNQKSSRREEEIPSKQSGRKSQKISSSSQKGKSRKSKKSNPRQRLTAEDRDQLEIEKDRKTTKTVIIIASIIIVGLVSLITANILFLNAAYDKVLKINIGDDKLFKDYMAHPSIRELSGYGSSGVSKIIFGIEDQILNNGSESLKKNLIVSLAATFKKDRSLSDSNIAIEKLKKFIDIGEGDTKSFAISALAYIPSGITELGNIVKSDKVDTNTSWLAFNSLLESKDEIPGDVLVMALKKQDEEFVSKVLPVISKNLSEFSKEPDALRALFKTIKENNADNANIATGLLSTCIKTPKHYQTVMNNCQSGNKRVKKAALDALLDVSAINGGIYWSKLAENSELEDVLLKVIPKLGDEDCQEYFSNILPKLQSKDIKVIEATLLALGKMENSPSKGLKEIIPFLTHDNLVLKKAAILSVAGFRYLSPFQYAKTPKSIPIFRLMKNVGSNNKEIKDATIASLKKITKKSFGSTDGWQGWWIKEKSALDLVVAMESKYNVVRELIKPKNKWKEAKVEVELLMKIYDTLSSEYIHRWKGFSKYLDDRGVEFFKAKGLINKFKRVID
ncbi:MAG: hypothetical protein COA79_14710 [Planctomycetota bacterium]|nr:MAG: hypothetical protein COA79_14710 [Planctomycetota bacterium]